MTTAAESVKTGKARIDRTGTHSKPCSWCEHRWHQVWEPHADTPPGDQYDPTLFGLGRDERPFAGKVSRWFKADVAELVDPSNDHYGAGHRVEFLAWMIRESYRKEFEPPYGTATIFDLIQNQSSTINGSGPIGIGVRRPGHYGPDWRDHVTCYFHNAVLCRSAGPSARKLRETLGITYGSTVVVRGPRSGDEYEVGRLLDAILPIRGDMAWQLNTCHAGAISIHDIRLTLDRNVGIGIEFGYPKDSSSWHRTLATQRPHEPIAFMLRRAAKELGRLMDPEAESPMVDRWAAHGGKPAEPALWVTGRKEPLTP